MTAAPRTLAHSEPFDDVEAFLGHFYVHLSACKITQSLAPDVEMLLTELGHHRAARAKLARILFALQARQIFCDDDLNLVLDTAKAALGADTSEAGVALYKDVFENKSPTDTRKYVLGPQLTTMTFWPGKMSGSQRPEVQEIGHQARLVTEAATALLNDIGAADTALMHFDTGPRTAFIETCNAVVKRIFGQLSELEHAPPPNQKGPIPPGFVDRFILRDTSRRTTTVKDQEEAVERTKAKLTRQEADLLDLKSKQAKELNDRLTRELKAQEEKASNLKRGADDAAAELARIKAEIEKNKLPPDDDTK